MNTQKESLSASQALFGVFIYPLVCAISICVSMAIKTGAAQETNVLSNTWDKRLTNLGSTSLFFTNGLILGKDFLATNSPEYRFYSDGKPIIEIDGFRYPHSDMSNILVRFYHEPTLTKLSNCWEVRFTKR